MSTSKFSKKQNRKKNPLQTLLSSGLVALFACIAYSMLCINQNDPFAKNFSPLSENQLLASVWGCGLVACNDPVKCDEDKNTLPCTLPRCDQMRKTAGYTQDGCKPGSAVHCQSSPDGVCWTGRSCDVHMSPTGPTGCTEHNDEGGTKKKCSTW